MNAPLVIIESPYAGDVDRNITYARACVRDSLLRGEAPYASHLLYTQPGILDDTNPEERKTGIDRGHSFIAYAHLVAVCTDNGISDGMNLGIARARMAQVPIEYRALGGEWEV